MGGKSGSAPQALNYNDYSRLLQQQGASNVGQFNYALGASRTNSTTPYGRTYWRQTSDTPGSSTPGTPDSWSGSGGSAQTAGSMGGSNGTTYKALEAGDVSPFTPGAGTSSGALPSDFGNFNYGNPGTWEQVQELSPEQQQIYDQSTQQQISRGNIANGMLGNLASTYSNPANYADQYTGATKQNVSYDQDAAKRYEDAYYDKSTSRLIPQQDRETQQLRDQLIQSGHQEGDEGWKRAMDQLDQRHQQALADARDQSIMGGQSAATQELSRALQSAQFGASEDTRAGQAQLQRIGLLGQDRSRQLNEYNAFNTGSQIYGSPFGSGTSSTPGLNGVDVTGSAQSAQQGMLGQWSANQAADASNTQGMMNTGLAAYALYLY